MKRSKRNRRKELYYTELWVAGCIPLFLKPNVTRKIIDGLKWCCEKRGLHIYEYVILPDRLMFISDTAWGPYEDVLEIFKKVSSKAVTKLLQSKRKNVENTWISLLMNEKSRSGSPELFWIWDPDRQVMELLYQQEQHDRFAEIIHNRPVELGWVGKAEHYRYGSASPVNPLNGWIVEAFDPWS